jgi:hypothetical protein
LQSIDQGREILLEQATVALFRGIMINEESSTFDEAWDHEDPKARRKWRDAIKRSFAIWMSNKFGRSLRNRVFQRIEEQSNVNGSSR